MISMPSESPWPIVLACTVTILFVMLVTGHLLAGALLGALCAVILAAWHSQEPDAVDAELA